MFESLTPLYGAHSGTQLQMLTCTIIGLALLVASIDTLYKPLGPYDVLVNQIRCNQLRKGTALVRNDIQRCRFSMESLCVYLDVTAP